MSKAIALLAGLGAGYLANEKLKDDEKYRASRDAREQAKFDADMADRKLATDDKNALRAAAAPVEVTPGDEFNPAKDMPVPTGDFKVGAARFADEGVANAEAAKQNDPKAVRSRVMSTLASQGNVLGADQLRTSGIQADAAQGQLDELHQQQQGREFARGVAGSLAQGGWKGFAKFATEKYNDDNKYEAVEDGKGGAIIIAKGKDGKEIGRQSFATPEDAIMFSVGRADPTKWAEYKAGRDDKKNADDNAKTGLKIAQQNANTSEQYRRDQATNMEAQRKLEGERIAALQAKATGAGQPIQLGIKDLRDFESDLTGHIKEQYPVKDGATPEERATMNATATSKKALGNSIFQSNAQIGTPLTAGTVLQAMELATDRSNIRIIQVNGQPHEGVVVNGQTVITSGVMQKKAPAAAAPQATPAGMATQGVTPPQPTPAAAVPQAAPAAVVPPQKAAAMQPLNDAVAQAEQALAAAAQSGDPSAVATYSAPVEAARAARLKEAVRLFGPTEAQQYIASLQRQ